MPFLSHLAVTEAMDLIANGDLSDVDIDDWSEEDVDDRAPQLNDSDDETDVEDNLTEVEKTKVKKEKVEKTFTWKRSLKFSSSVPAVPDVIQLLNKEAHDHCNYEPIHYFSNYIDDDMYKTIADCTNTTCVIKSGKSPNVTPSEVKTFVGMTLLMSTLGYPDVKMYWQNRTRVPTICESMQRDRYFFIQANMKVVVDIGVSDVEKENKLWKVQPMIDSVRNGCLRIPRSVFVSVDEQTIPFTGTTQLKQYVPRKPNQVGLKKFVIADPSGIVLDFVIYQGKGSFPMQNDAKSFTIGEAAVMKLCETLTAGTRVFFGRYFTTINLIAMLHEKGIGATGTIMRNRIPKSNNLISDKALQDEGRGSCDHVVRSDEKMNLVKWQDNKPIYMISSEHSVDVKDTCKRWSKNEKKYIDVSRPEVIKEYNLKMSGVDKVDRTISYYRVKTQTKKWTVKVLIHLMDLAAANSWLQYRRDCLLQGFQSKDMSKFLDFRISVAEKLLSVGPESTISSSEDEKQPVEKKPRLARPSIPFRQKEAKHMPEVAVIKNSAYCRNTGCSKKTKFRCIACKMFLCITAERNCFKNFHESQ